jgi:hypothetical protein
VALADYAVTADVLAFLPLVPVAQQATWAGLISDASREIDGYCQRYFYADGVGTKYFDVPGDPYSGQSWPQVGGRGAKSFFCLNHDFYALTALKVAQIENGNPGSPTDWVTLTGDGITPPSDFFLEPANNNYVGKNGNSQPKPFYWIDLPAYGPTTSTTFRGYFTAGKRTVSITANWGWPVVPDQIKDITVKIVIRMFKGQQTGFTGATGFPEGTSAVLLKYLDANDFNTLNRYRKWIANF